MNRQAMRNETYRAKLQQYPPELSRPKLQRDNTNSSGQVPKVNQNTPRNLIKQKACAGRITSKRSASADLEHVVRALVDAVEVPQREPPAEGGADLQRAAEHEERAAAVHGRDAVEVVRGGELRFGGRALLEQVPGAPGECVLVGADDDGTGRGGEGRRHQPPAWPRSPPPQSRRRDCAGLEEKHLDSWRRGGSWGMRILGTEIFGRSWSEAGSEEDETGETDGIGAKWSSSVCNGMIFCGSAFSGANSTSERAARIFWSACRTARNEKHAGGAGGDTTARSATHEIYASEDHDETCLVPDSELCYPLPLAVGRITARAGEQMAIVAVLVAPTASSVGPRRRWPAAATSSSAASGVDLKALQAAIDKVSAEREWQSQHRLSDCCLASNLMG